MEVTLYDNWHDYYLKKQSKTLKLYYEVKQEQDLTNKGIQTYPCT